VAFDAPLLVVQGDADIVVVPARTDAYVERACAAGQNVSVTIVPGGDHNLRLDDLRAEIGAWLEARQAGEPATSGC
jgi:pimeloyl-ACP methyl ester carboxylesterase